MMMFSMADWEKTTIEEVKRRQGNKRKELEEIERKKKERDEKIEIWKKKKEKRRRAIRERRCFVCGIFGYMARNCRNRGEEKKGSQMPLNKFEVLKQREVEERQEKIRERF